MSGRHCQPVTEEGTRPGQTQLQQGAATVEMGRRLRHDTGTLVYPAETQSGGLEACEGGHAVIIKQVGIHHYQVLLRH